MPVEPQPDPPLHADGPLVHRVPVSDLTAQGRDVSIAVTETEREAVAASCDLVALNMLRADFHVARGSGALLIVTGTIAADVVQTCCASLKPVEAQVSAEVALTYTLESDAEDAGEVDIAPHGDDPPEPVVDGYIDFGALAVEHLILNLDPYPRLPGTDIPVEYKNMDAEGDEIPESSPFSVLSALQTRGKNT